jgi:two-component system, chemotaxis family, CheB/CheR fusion protein
MPVTEILSQSTKTFPIAGIGASAGGLDALQKLLENLPQDANLAIVIIQHLATNQASMLPEILSRSTKMPVNKVESGIHVKPSNVYVIPSGSTMTIENGVLMLHPKVASFKPIDGFLNSLALDQKTQAIGIILSGTGTDGTEGLKNIKAEGGITFAQEPKTAQYPDMPKSAINAETAYFILPPEQIAQEIDCISKHPEIARQKIEEPKTQQEGETNMQTIFTLLKAESGVNFTNYKRATINRRISRRMILTKNENIKQYIAYLRSHPEEQQALFEDMLISVTSFFREPNTFMTLKEKVFPILAENRQPEQPIRVWIPGCSTGEEVYSIAIALTEFSEEKNSRINLQFFGTDVNPKNIERARRGIYQKVIEENMSEERLKRFFTASSGNYQVIKKIRDKCVFARHDLTQDPPLSNLDLILCRNLLIYIDIEFQDRIIATLNYALKPNRYLVLGESESVGKFSDVFEPIAKRGAIFRKKSGQPKMEVPLQRQIPYSKETITSKSPKAIDPQAQLKEEVDNLLLEQYVPSTLLVNNNSDIVAIRGMINPYISVESGTPSFSIAKMVRKELRPTIQTAIFRAKKTGQPVKQKVRFEQNKHARIVNVEVKPLKLSNYEEPFFLVLLEEKEKAQDKAVPVYDESENARSEQIRELSEDLAATKQTLQTVIEQQETVNEELRSANEEVQSSNEELMSTNEELETSKEELQSSNEELTTLNDELKNRNEDLGRLNDDLTNLMNNLDTAVVIVDRGFKIKRFTASAQELLRLTSQDIDHSIVNIRLGIPVEDLEQPLDRVINNKESVRKEIYAGKNSWFQTRIRPYLTEEKTVGGAVLSFADISELKTLAQQVKAQEEKLAQSEMLATIGKTAGMVGHDIRNPLQAITSDVFLVKQDLALMPKSEQKKGIEESLASIEENVDYINKIVLDLQDYARTSAPVKVDVDLEKAVTEAVTSVDIPEKILLTMSVEKNLPKLCLDASYLRRILANLILNAVQAMPDGGKLIVESFRQRR